MQIAVHTGMSLFDAPHGSCLVHATNCVGSWGAGIALEFQKRFHDAYLVYNFICRTYDKQLLGQGLVIPEKSHSIGCLFTSFAYGQHKDSPDVILEQTKSALRHFLKQTPQGMDIYSGKFNSGLFGVPWEKTEALLLEIEDKRTWHLCIP